MQIRAQYQSSLSLEDEEQTIREEALNGAMHCPTIDEAEGTSAPIDFLIAPRAESPRLVKMFLPLSERSGCI